jgi:hypothetical protein
MSHRLCIALISLSLAGSAVAQTPPAESEPPAAAPEAPPAATIPPPATPLTEDTIRAWIDGNLETQGWVLLAADAVAASFATSDGVTQDDKGLLTTEIRREYYGLSQLGPNGTRSGRQTWVVDCKGKKVWVRKIAIYADNNLKGASRTRENPDPKWTELSQGSVNAMIMDRICRTPTSGLKPQGPARPS